ncbi:AAA family ATPase [Evansella tamaricis]|uniref:NERD domain-containing protein n=1 Tax=Evansella tamaricis TaxID=2069301 RepID=A0ABS6JHE0_9BACI|nr:AAA family ATPase [Evansella tamaricis]MBU9713046.1 NERD domain-containing protein [Evansella tamaricis]
MARMVPDCLPETIQNQGERLFYEKARELPDSYTVFYSYKFALDDARQDPYGLREADFVIVHQSYGFAVVEVKEGDVHYFNGVWQEMKNGQYRELSKDPIRQARDAMFSILNRYKNLSNSDYPLHFRYALCFPDTLKRAGFLPEDLNEKSCWSHEELLNLEESFKGLFANIDRSSPYEATKNLITKVLSPSFRVFSNLDDKLTMLRDRSEIILTEEQDRILEETEEDHRKIFFGAAGTGKTFIAMKKALDLASVGKKVFLTCYNKQLVTLLKKHCEHENISITNFHDFLESIKEEHSYVLEMPKSPDLINKYYSETLPNYIYELYSIKSETEKFDAILVDEGQDFKENWFICLDEMVKKDGHFYIFADRHQNLFGNGLDALKDFEMSKHKLTINLRNTQKINEWTQPLIENNRLRYKIVGGLPVEYIPCKDPQTEKRLLEKEINKLVSQGLSPHRITILSPHKKGNSSLKEVDRIGQGPWLIYDLSEGRKDGIAFSTIRAFKGLESDVVLIIGVKKNSKVCTPTDLYVGGTRARFILKIFHQEEWSFKEMTRKIGDVDQCE